MKTIRSGSIRAALLACAAVFLLSVPALAADVPHILVHQGYLADKDGKPVEGTVDLGFAIYRAEAGEDPAAVWEQPAATVSVTGGFYTVNLGIAPDAFALSDQYPDLYLEVRTGREPNVKKMTPRQRLGSVPYSLKCLDWVGDKSGLGTVKSVTTAEPLTGGPITDSGTIGIQQASGTQPGYISAADWNTFNDKQSRVTGVCEAGKRAVSLNVDGTVNCEPCVTGVVATAPLTGGGTGGDVTIGIPQADGTQSGFLSAGDWSSFTAKQNTLTGSCDAGSAIRAIMPNGSYICETDDNSGGTVTNIATGTGLSGGPISTTGTISLAASYADGSAYDARFVNAAGDTMTGTLGVPADGFTVGTDQLVCVDGRVGMGTNAPRTEVEITRSQDNETRLLVSNPLESVASNSAGVRIEAGLQSGAGKLYTDVYQDNLGQLNIRHELSTVPLVTVGKDNVGIGTQPFWDRKLTISLGASEIAAGLVQLGLSAGSGEDFAIRRTTTESEIFSSFGGPGSARDLVLSVHGSGASGEVVRLTAGGNVGIGTTSPGEKLDVFGTIKFGDNRNDLRIWEAVATNGGASCDGACGNGYCVGAYIDDSSTKQTCSSTTNNRQCICMGKP